MNTKFTSKQYFNFDSWQGYPAERADLVRHIRDNSIRNVVFCTGDIHTFAAGDVVVDPNAAKTTDDGKAVATEFVAGSITSQGLGDGGIGPALGWNKQKTLDASRALYPKTEATTYALLFGANPWLANGDTDHHGYGRVRASSTGFTCDLVRAETIKATTIAGAPVKALPLIEAGTDRTMYTNGLWPRFTWTVKPGYPSIRDVRK